VHQRLYNRQERPKPEETLSFKPAINQTSRNILKRKESRSRQSSRESSPTPYVLTVKPGYKINTSLGGFDKQTDLITQLLLKSRNQFIFNQ
jgi:hypothetical protein